MDNKFIAGIVVVILIVAGVGVYFLLVNNNGNDAQEIQTFEDMKKGDYFTYTIVANIMETGDQTSTMTVTLKTVSGDNWTIETKIVGGDEPGTTTQKMTKSEFIASLKTTEDGSSTYMYIDVNNPPSDLAELTRGTGTIHLDIGDRDDITFKGTFTNQSVSATIDAAYSQKGVLYDVSESITGLMNVQMTLTATSMNL